MLASTKTPAKVFISRLNVDSFLIMRARMSNTFIEEYQEIYKNQGLTGLPPLVGFEDDTGIWLADGFHRLEAIKRNGGKQVLIDVFPGTRRDAILYAVGANAERGLPRSIEDKRKSVLALLTDDEWKQWSDNRIAKQCKVSQTLVSSMREVLNNLKGDQPVERLYKKQDGRVVHYNSKRMSEANSQGKQRTNQTVRCPHCGKRFDLPS